MAKGEVFLYQIKYQGTSEQGENSIKKLFLLFCNRFKLIFNCLLDVNT